MNNQRLVIVIVAMALCVPAAWSIGVRGGGGGGGRAGGGGGRAGGGASVSRGGGGAPRAAAPTRSAAPARSASSSAPRPSVSRSAGAGPQTARTVSPQRTSPAYSSQIARPTGNLNPSVGSVNRSQTSLNRPGAANYANRPNVSVPSYGLAARTGGKAGGIQPGSMDRIRADTGLTGPLVAHPPSGDITDFIGMDRPLTSGASSVRPGTGGLATPGVRPGTGGLVTPGVRPGAGGQGTPGIAARQPAANRPINIGQRTNNAISARPSWSNINADRVNSVRNNWNRAIVNQPNLSRWNDLHPDRGNQWNRWGDNVRRDWDVNYYNRNWNWNGNIFGHDWWSKYHDLPVPGWHYGHNFDRYDYNYWWSTPTWPALTSWFTWSAPQQVWTQPVYYDYGPGGNVVYENNAVYVNGQDVATAPEFAQSAAELATVAPPPDEQQAAQAEWYPLGTFAVSSSEKETTPNRIVQLAVDRQGIISGTVYNTQTDQAQAIQGQVDPQTQRVAMRIGESENVIVETGLYDLTQDQAPVLVHFGPDRVENYLLVRLNAPETTEVN